MGRYKAKDAKPEDKFEEAKGKLFFSLVTPKEVIALECHTPAERDEWASALLLLLKQLSMLADKSGGGAHRKQLSTDGGARTPTKGSSERKRRVTGGKELDLGGKDEEASRTPEQPREKSKLSSSSDGLRLSGFGEIEPLKKQKKKKKGSQIKKKTKTGSGLKKRRSTIGSGDKEKEKEKGTKKAKKGSSKKKGSRKRTGSGDTPEAAPQAAIISEQKTAQAASVSAAHAEDRKQEILNKRAVGREERLQNLKRENEDRKIKREKEREQEAALSHDRNDRLAELRSFAALRHEHQVKILHMAEALHLQLQENGGDPDEIRGAEEAVKEIQKDVNRRLARAAELRKESEERKQREEKRRAEETKKIAEASKKATQQQQRKADQVTQPATPIKEEPASKAPEASIIIDSEEPKKEEIKPEATPETESESKEDTAHGESLLAALPSQGTSKLSSMQRSRPRSQIGRRRPTRKTAKPVAAVPSTLVKRYPSPLNEENPNNPPFNNRAQMERQKSIPRAMRKLTPIVGEVNAHPLNGIELIMALTSLSHYLACPLPFMRRASHHHFLHGMRN